MINLEDIKGHSALDLLEKYSGNNPFLKKLKKDYLANKKVKLTENQIKYIIENHQKDPILINKLVNITQYLGEELKQKNNLSFTPERILVEYILAENEKTFHIYGKLKKNQEKSEMYWLPKTQVLDDPYYENVEVEVG